ncbi:MAG: flavin reductase [Thermotogae bacterium]|nr:MAG: flavin reductase [Thermotogota bacterium]
MEVKSAFDLLTHGVYIVSSAHEGENAGMTAAWVMQSSYKPKILAVSIAPSRFTASIIEKSGLFCIQVLSKQDRAIGELFGYKSQRDLDKFAEVEWFKSEKFELPVLQRTLAYFECELCGKLTAGDHVIYNGTVVNYKLMKADETPMLFHMREWF